MTLPSLNVDLTADSLSIKVELSPELVETLAHISRLTGDPLDTVIGKAVALYRMGAEAHAHGKRIGVFDQDFELEQEVVGFDHRAAS